MVVSTLTLLWGLVWQCGNWQVLRRWVVGSSFCTPIRQRPHLLPPPSIPPQSCPSAAQMAGTLVSPPRLWALIASAVASRELQPAGRSQPSQSSPPPLNHHDEMRRAHRKRMTNNGCGGLAIRLPVPARPQLLMLLLLLFLSFLWIESAWEVLVCVLFVCSWACS